MKKVLKFLLVVLIWTVVLGVCVTAAVLLDYPMQTGAWVFATIFGIWYGIKILVYLVKRWRAKRRVQQLINVDVPDAEQKNFRIYQYLAPRDVDKHIARVINRLAKSDISRVGAAEDLLQWTMHLKFDNAHSDWIEASSANRPKIIEPAFSEFDHIEWRVFNQFVMLDVDAYLLQEGNPSAKNEWIELLNGLSYSKKRKALDGLMVSLHIDQLQSESEQSRIADRIRIAYENIKEYCGVEVPISLVLLGLEDLKGIETWTGGLEEEMRRKILGKVNSNNVPAVQIIENCFGDLQNVLKQGSLAYLMANGYNQHAAGVAHHANNIKQALAQVVARTFSVNNFQRSPTFAGLFFVVNRDGTSMFVEDLLEGSALVWRSAEVTRQATVSDNIKRVNLAAYYAGSALLVVLLIMVYSAGHTVIEKSVNDYQKALLTSNDGLEVVNKLQARYEYVLALQNINMAHWFPIADDPLKLSYNRAKYMKDLNELLLRPMDESFSKKLGSVDPADLDAKVDYLNILVRRINLLDAVINGASMANLREMSQPYDSAYLDTLPKNVLDEINTLVLHGFELGRQDSSSATRSEWLNKKTAYKQQLSTLVLNSDISMDWLITWANNNKLAKDVKRTDYWQPTSGKSQSLVAVDRAYTVGGKDLIDKFIVQLSTALDQDDVFVAEYVPRFYARYQQNYIASWGAFLNSFNEGADQLQSRNEWLGVLNNLATGRNIFFNLLNDVDYQLAPYADVEIKPDWFEFILYYQNMLALGEDKVQSNSKKNGVLTKLALKMVGATGSVGKAIATSAKSGLKTQKKLDKASGDGPGPSERELNLQDAAKELDNYKALLADVVFEIERRSASYANIKGEFDNPDNPGAAGTKLAAVQSSISQLQALIGKVGTSTAPFWNVYMGSVLVAEKFMLRETACYVDGQWQENYLYELAGVPDYKLSEFAFSETGLLWKFTDEHLAPFLNKRLNAGYGFKRINGHNVPLTAGLLDYLARAKDEGQRQKFQTFDLDVTAMPTSLNKNALLFVSETELTLQCEAGEQSLINSNFILDKRFIWDPSCGQTSLRFTIGNRVIEKKYAGPTGLTQFLKDFETGEHIFDIEEFPEYFYLLKQFEIRRIQVNFQLEGGKRLLAALDQQPPKPPANIALCWN
ncbi:hypothetical protein N8Z40_00690 [Pseudomonadales bacterium]|nr:hypothetical protein [Pseudomonadales bacterium]